VEDRTLNNLDCDLFFQLVRNLTTASVQSGLYGSLGQAVDTNIAGLPQSIDDLPLWGDAPQANVPRQVEKASHNDHGYFYRTPVLGFAGEVLGTFAVAVAAPFDGSEEQRDELVIHALDMVVNLIEKQIQLEIELDSMAAELIGRYEELNLIYHSEDDVRNVDRDGKALKRLIDQCVEHLNVSFVALSIPRQERILCSISESNSIPETFQLIRRVQDEFFARLEEEDRGFIINDVDDPTRVEFEIPYKLLCTPVVDGLGKTIGLLVCFNEAEHSDFFNSDRSLLKVVGRKVAKIIQANYDELTGIYNRRAFESIVENALIKANERGVSHSLLNVNLDQLKVVNDAIGRDAGNWIIEQTAILLQAELRETDSIGYLGDGKYGILLERCDLDSGALVAEQLRLSVQNSARKWEGKRVDLSVTVGVSLIEPNTVSTDEVLEAAEIALDSARQNGVNQIRVFSHDDEYVSTHRMHVHWANYLQTALREDRFQIYAQTIQPVKPSTRRFYFEALVRLVDDDGEIVLPGKFIPPAEKFNLMPLIDRWVINATFECLARNGLAKAMGGGIVSINLSGQSVASFELADYIAEKLEQYQIEPSCVCFEITETAAIQDFSYALKVLNQIKKPGCQLALDDFGTGLSSFSYLRSLPVNYVKIDGSFVRFLLEDDVSHAMVTSINQVSHVMGLETVAEFVENDAIRDELELIGVDYLQGFGIARPVPLQECLDAIDDQQPVTVGRQLS
jgi:diguanylate cyclase (GGDEF)-like protein